MNTEAFAQYSSAWLAIAGAALVGALCLNSLLKRIGGVRSVVGRSLRWTLVITVLAAFTLPAEVPGAEQISAPAFIVLLFESSFQADGDPSAAQRIMLAGLAAVFVGTFTASVLTQIAWQRVRRLGASTVASGVENRDKCVKREHG